MRRRSKQETTAAGQDSFLDIVANIVGILIILVMVTGMRIRNATVEAASTDQSIRVEMASIEQDRATANSLRHEVLGAAAGIRDLTRERIVRREERDRLATLVAAWEHKIRSHRDQLDDDARKTYDLHIELSDAKVELAKLVRKRAAAEAAQAPPTLIQSYPTPLSKPVDGREAHFHLRAGRVAFIPLEDLLREFKEDARQQAHTLLGQPELTETVGPIGGFRLRYTLVRQEVRDEDSIAGGGAGTYATLKRWTLVPTATQLGEPVDTALASGSRFRQSLGEFNPDQTTVTIWAYPDSFAEFRRLRKELYELGFPTAARPLPHGVPIGGSPEGSKSAAQ
ncbi:MAG: hypothetical protein ABIP48_23350 [Planctomycetota bacterium]